MAIHINKYSKCKSSLIIPNVISLLHINTDVSKFKRISSYKIMPSLTKNHAIILKDMKNCTNKLPPVGFSEFSKSHFLFWRVIQNPVIHLGWRFLGK